MQEANPNCKDIPKNALVLPPTPQLKALLTIIRDVNTQRGEFVL